MSARRTQKAAQQRRRDEFEAELRAVRRQLFDRELRTKQSHANALMAKRHPEAADLVTQIEQILNRASDRIECIVRQAHLDIHSIRGEG